MEIDSRYDKKLIPPVLDEETKLMEEDVTKAMENVKNLLVSKVSILG